MFVKSPKSIDGMKFGTLLAIKQVQSLKLKSGASKSCWLMKCIQCEKEEDIPRNYLLTGQRKHCRWCRSWNVGNQNRKGKTLKNKSIETFDFEGT